MFKELSDGASKLVAKAYPWAVGVDCCDDEANHFICTRPIGHDGPHVAHATKYGAVAMWSDFVPEVKE